MAGAAREAGARLGSPVGVSKLRDAEVDVRVLGPCHGYAVALKESARAGHSEHQLGTTVDFRSYGGSAPWDYTDWATTKAGAWLKANAWKYGFVMSYPKGKTSVTCYAYEPWHYRYVGRTARGAIRASGLTLREYLWREQNASVPTPTPTADPDADRGQADTDPDLTRRRLATLGF